MAAGHLHAEGAEDEDDGVEPEDGRNGGWEPLVDVLVVGVEVSAGLADKEGADDGDEEHEVAGEGEEDAHAVAAEAFARALVTVGAFIPIVVVAPAAGTLVGWRTAPRPIVVIFYAATLFPFSVDRRDGRWHCGLSSHALGTAYSGFVSRVMSGTH